MSHAPDALIYTGYSLRTVPHKIRVKRVIEELRKTGVRFLRYADVGCGGGSITKRIARAIQPSVAVGYDSNPDLIEFASKAFPEISFRLWSVTTRETPREKYDLVTCLETLEHVADLESALTNLLGMTTGVLFVTVPIELGLMGFRKDCGEGSDTSGNIDGRAYRLVTFLFQDGRDWWRHIRVSCETKLWPLDIPHRL